MIRTSLVLASVSLLLACQGTAPDVTLSTTGGHIVDSRAWAVDSRIGLSASWDTPELATVHFETPNGESLVQEDVRWADREISLPFGSGYANRAGVIAQATDFDVVVMDPSGREFARQSLRTAEVADIALGIALDDCPEFADVVVPDDAVFLEGTELMVYPAPLDADGNHLLGGFDFQVSGDVPTLDGWDLGADFGVSWPTSVSLGEGGSLDMTLQGETHGFAVRTVRPEDIVAVGISAQAEKHGNDDEALLTVFGETADGARVFGVAAQWSGSLDAFGSQSTWIHAREGEVVDACVGALCATWGE